MSTIHHKKSHSDEDEILIEEQGEALQNIFDLRAIDTLDGNEEDEVNLPGSNIVYVGIHEKLSDPLSTSPPTPLPTTPPPLSAFTSLRAYHQSSNSNSGNNGNGAIHHKQSQEKNGVNPEELPEIWKAPPAPVNTESPTPAPTEDVRRVNPAPDSSTATTDMGGKRVCSSVDGSFGTQSSKNNGVVLRYQYELTQDLSDIDWNINSRGERDGSDYLKSDVLPVLEGAISDWLLPELFEECVREDSEGFVIGEGGRRLSDVVGSNSALDEKSGGLRQQRRLSSVIGLDAEPVDFALEQTECTSNYTPSDPLKSTQCHHIEGALTLYFPPTYSLTSLLSSTTLTTLKSIQEGMEKGTLKESHHGILDLTFLDGSFSLTPILPGDKSVDSSSTEGSKGNGGLVAGIVIPLLLVLCLGVLLGWRTHQAKKSALNEEELDMEEDVYTSPKTWVASNGDQEEDVHDDADDHSTTSSGSSSTGGEGTATDEEEEYNDDGTSSYSSQDSEEIYVDDEDDDFDQERDLNSMYGNKSPYGSSSKKKERQQKRKKPNTNIVIGGGDEMSVATGATGATGMHSVASERTVKMKNIVLPSIDINMR